MKTDIAEISDDKLKVVGFTDQVFAASSKKYSNAQELEAACSKSGMLETVWNTPLDTVKSISYKEQDDSLQVKYDKKHKGKIKSSDWNFKSHDKRNAFAQSLAEQLGFQKNVNEETKIKPLLINLFYVVLAAGATWIAYDLAVDAQQGIHFEATGRRSGIKQLFASAAEILGPMGSLAVGGIITLLLVLGAYKRFNNPSNEITFE